jgi:hypothetical protein
MGFHPVAVIVWKNMVQPDRPQMAVRHMRIACWIPKVTNTHSKYVIFTSVPLQQTLHEPASVLRCTCTACLAELHYYCILCLYWLLFLCSVAVLLINTLDVNTGIVLFVDIKNPEEHIKKHI